MGNLFSNYKKEYDNKSIVLNSISIKNYKFKDKYTEIITYKPIDNWKDSNTKNIYAGHITILIYENNKRENLICCINAYTWNIYINIERNGIIKDISFYSEVINRFDLLDKGSVLNFFCKINLDDINYTFQAYTTFNKFDNYPKQLIDYVTPIQHVNIIY